MAASSEIEKLEARYAENPDGRYFAPLADAYRKAGRVDDALQLVRRGLEKHPDYLSAHIVLGRCQLDKKDDPAASSAFETVLGLDSENIIALKSLSEISERAGDMIAARRWLQKLLVVDAMNTDAEADLQRLGGPLPEEGGEAAPVEEAPSAEISFADVTEASPPTAAVPAPVAEPVPMMALEEPAPLPMTEAPTEPIPAIELDVPLPPPEVAPMPDVAPFDESLQWGGAGARMSSAINMEDLEQAHHEPPLVAPAIDFLAPASPPPAPPADAPSMADTVPVPGIEIPMPESAAPPAADRAGDEVMAPVAEEAEAPAVAEEERSSGELKLIMPEDVTPPEEMARPSTKQVQIVSPPPDEEAEAVGAGGGAAAPMLTETMGDLYLKQGFRSQAADVYRGLLSQRPGDATLRAKLAQVEGPPPSWSATALGLEPVGSWLLRVARASLGTPRPSPPPEPPASEEPTPMEAAFAAPEPEPPSAPEPEPVVEGEPARPATSAFSLDQIFGAESGGSSPGMPMPTPPSPTPPSASFDEFFGAAPEQDSVRPKPAEASAPADDDLSTFNAWLHGLKR